MQAVGSASCPGYLKSRQRVLDRQRDYHAAHKAEITAVKKSYLKKLAKRLAQCFCAYCSRHIEKLLGRIPAASTDFPMPPLLWQ
jgi:hypothetical protein